MDGTLIGVISGQGYETINFIKIAIKISLMGKLD